ncbi:MAG: hypothetical protein K0Q95_1372 [Bacteroidota bacterium]|jgi:hypothetical protein|nr:hypothetical protein [Bacteroidota bacterium]
MKFKKIFLTVLIFTAPYLATVSKAAALGMGTGMGMGPPNPCGGPFPPCPIPLDSSVILLLIAGMAFGGYKIYSSLKKNPA